MFLFFFYTAILSQLLKITNLFMTREFLNYVIYLLKANNKIVITGYFLKEIYL